jgi:hypothetical protein
MDPKKLIYWNPARAAEVLAMLLEMDCINGEEVEMLARWVAWDDATNAFKINPLGRMEAQ